MTIIHPWRLASSESLVACHSELFYCLPIAKMAYHNDQAVNQESGAIIAINNSVIIDTTQLRNRRMYIGLKVGLSAYGSCYITFLIEPKMF